MWWSHFFMSFLKFSRKFIRGFSTSLCSCEGEWGGHAQDPRMSAAGGGTLPHSTGEGGAGSRGLAPPTGGKTQGATRQVSGWGGHLSWLDPRIHTNGLRA